MTGIQSDSEAESVLSFRNYLQAGIRHFVADFKSSEFAADLLAEFIIVLSSYQEEGVRLFPIVFIGENLSEILSVTKGVDSISIGQGDQSRESVRRAFRKFAPLTEGREWAGFVIIDGSEIKYGLFRTNHSPLIPTAFECLRQTSNPNYRILGLSRLGGSFVEVRSANGNFQYINMPGDYTEAKNPPKLVNEFMESVTKDSPASVRPHLRSFYYRVGVDLLHANHGSLIVVIPADQEVPSIFQDGIVLKDRIRIADTISKYLSGKDESSFQSMMGWSQLLRRMTRMDGITIIDTCGSIVGYNCFVNQKTFNGKRVSGTSGGARRRAFESLCEYLGPNLTSVIYKSHDGIIEMAKA